MHHSWSTLLPSFPFGLVLFPLTYFSLISRSKGNSSFFLSCQQKSSHSSISNNRSINLQSFSTLQSARPFLQKQILMWKGVKSNFAFYVLFIFYTPSSFLPPFSPSVTNFFFTFAKIQNCEVFFRWLSVDAMRLCPLILFYISQHYSIAEQA